MLQWFLFKREYSWQIVALQVLNYVPKNQNYADTMIAVSCKIDQNPAILKPTKYSTLSQSETSNFPVCQMRDQVILPGEIIKIKKKSALCLSQSAFSNFALCV